MKSIKTWPESDRPREKLLAKGASELTNTELLAILIGSGSKKNTAIDLARHLLHSVDHLVELVDKNQVDFLKIKGLGPAKVAKVMAALALSKRISFEKKETDPKISSSEEAYQLFREDMFYLKKEVFDVLLLDSKNKVIRKIRVTTGTVGEARPILREIFDQAIRYFASAIICAHNHPSGDPEPSLADKKFTNQLKAAAEVLEIPVLDHLIVCHNNYFSFRDANLM